MNRVLGSLFSELLSSGMRTPEPQDEPVKEQPQRPCDVAVVFATVSESGGLEDRLDGLLTVHAQRLTIKQGGLAGKHVVLAAGGVGQSAARQATEQLLAGHRPAWVISAGFAGGLTEALARGDFLLANEIVDLSGRRLGVDVAYQSEAQPGRPTVHLGRLLTVDRVICQPAEKRELGERFAALAVDMETMAVAEVCRDQKTRFLAVRIVSDAVDESLPEEVQRLMASSHPAGRFGAAVGAVWNRPAAFKDLWKLREQALVDSDRLAAFLAELIARLP